MTPALAASAARHQHVDRLGLRGGLAARARSPARSRSTAPAARPSSRRSPPCPARSSTTACSRRSLQRTDLVRAGPCRSPRVERGHRVGLRSGIVPAAVRARRSRRRGGARAVLPRRRRRSTRRSSAAACCRPWLAPHGPLRPRPCSRSCVRRRPMSSGFERAQVLLAVAGDPPAHARGARRLHRRRREARRLRAGPGAVGAGEERAAAT